MNSVVREILLDFIALFYPRYCLACECALVNGEDIVCTSCMLEMPMTDYHLDKENSFYQKLRTRLSVKYVMALFKFTKESRIQNLLHTMKYKNHPEIGIMLGKLYGSELLNANYKDEFDLIIPIPLHISRKRVRGYNQSAEFGKGLSTVLNIPCKEEIVERMVKTETQTKKTRLNRWENVKEVFRVIKPDEIVNKKILLVDDIITTGATLEACAKLLLNHKCKDVSIACIAAVH